jgi:hypothetical protein
MDVGHQESIQVILPHEEFHDDLETRLGRANGNIYHRQEGIEGVHDGQVMVRLKKKRYIVIDYSIIPNEQDFHIAATNPHITIPNGAGKQKCTTPECTKVGVPVCLYDSEPNEPISLYLRAGLCFTCQRNLNEKRRTQRKRPSDDMMHTPVLYAIGPGQKKVKLNGMSIDLTSDAIILNGHYGSTIKTTRDGYSFDEIAPDLLSAVHEASGDTQRLVHAISSNTTTAMTPPSPSNHNHHNHTTTTVALSVEEVANAAVEATTGILSGVGGPPSNHHHQQHHQHHHQPQQHEQHQHEQHQHEQQHHPQQQQQQQQLHHLHHHPSLPNGGGAATSDDINVLYDKAFLSLSRSVFLLTQWKQSWDSAIAAAVAQETVGDPSLADAVASAAAVAAAATEGTDNISLLLAADQRKDDIDSHNSNSNSNHSSNHNITTTNTLGSNGKDGLSLMNGDTSMVEHFEV